MEVVLYVHVSKDEPVPDSQSEDDVNGDDVGEIVVQHKYRRMSDITPEEMQLLDFIERARWPRIVRKRSATKFLLTGWTKLETCMETGGYRVPDDIRIVRVLHVTSYTIAIDAFDYDTE
jgi:hypothetical protein